VKCARPRSVQGRHTRHPACASTGHSLQQAVAVPGPCRHLGRARRVGIHQETIGCGQRKGATGKFQTLAGMTRRRRRRALGPSVTRPVPQSGRLLGGRLTASVTVTGTGTAGRAASPRLVVPPLKAVLVAPGCLRDAGSHWTSLSDSEPELPVSTRSSERSTSADFRGRNGNSDWGLGAPHASNTAFVHES